MERGWARAHICPVWACADLATLDERGEKKKKKNEKTIHNIIN